jgi:putative addiction module component (TIGR02574 family)
MPKQKDRRDKKEEMEKAWDGEITRRLQELRSGKVKAIPIEEVKRRMEKRFSFLKST